MTAEWVTAIATVAAAGIALVATVAAILYYRRYHKEVLQKNTMDLLGKLESCQVLNKIQHDLSLISNECNRDYSKIKCAKELEYVSSKMLNYFEDISYRYDKGLVDKEAIEEQIKEEMLIFVKVFIKGKEADGRKPPSSVKHEWEKQFEYLMKFYRQWEKEEGQNQSS